jgi:hypothetical protein
MEQISEREVIRMAALLINFCKRAQMCVCSAGDQKEQSDCSFYEKSQYANRCMYFMFDEYCDCLKAQLNASGEFKG